jgi:hypothetical protein
MLTEKQITDTVAAMRVPAEEKALLVKRALAGEPEARFVIVAAMRRQQTQ